MTRRQAAMISSMNMIFLKTIQEMKIEDEEGDVDEKTRKQPVDVKFL